MTVYNLEDTKAEDEEKRVTEESNEKDEENEDKDDDGKDCDQLLLYKIRMLYKITFWDKTVSLLPLCSGP